MSVIVVKKEKGKIVIGSDSQETGNQSYQENVYHSKLKQIEDDIYIAGAGDAHICSLLYAYAGKHSLNDVHSSWSLIEYFSSFNTWLTTEIYIDDSDENKDLLQRCQFLLILKDKVWHFSDFYTREIEDGEYTSIGSGSQAALACMSLNCTIEDAIKATCSVDIYCSLPSKIIEILLND